MLGYVSFEKCRWVHSKKEEICGGRFFCVILPQNPRERQVRKAARLLKKSGVRCAVFPSGYDKLLLWKRWGIEPPETMAFRRCLLLRILTWALEQGECVRAGICAQEADFWVQKAAKWLAVKSRYLFLDCGRGGEELSDILRREFGVAAVTEPTPHQLSSCDILVLFTPRKDAVCRGTTLPVYNGGGRPWRYYFRGMELYPRADAEQLGAALLEMGILREKDVKII